MTATTLNRSMGPAHSRSVATVTAPTTAPARKRAVLVGLFFLTATFTFAAGNALIHSYFSSATSHQGILVIGLILLVCDGLAVAANGLAMRPILTPHAPIRANTYLLLRVTECLTVAAIGTYFLTSHARWDGYVLAVYAISGAAGLILSSALLTTRIVPRSLSVLGVIGYPIFLIGSILAMFNQLDVTHGPGMLALVPGGLFELILPLWLFARGFTPRRIDE
jgi:Domain of unknown function (DUF4386)